MRFFTYIYFSAILLLLLPGNSSASDVKAKGVVVMETQTGRVLYGKNPNLKLPPASTAKLMTAMVALDRIDIHEVVTVSERATMVSPIKANFRKGERVSVNTLLRAALIKSANDAAYALSEAVAGSEDKFVELMNQKAAALGMNDTRFVNSTGLPEDGQYITAYDLARLLRHALRYPFIREIINTRTDSITTEEGRSIFLKNSNRLLWEDESIVGGKTGYTRGAKHCFVCASENEGESVIVAILGAPSREELWKESESLISKGFNILRGIEEPGIFFDRADYEGYVKKVSYKRSYKDSEVRSKEKKTKIKKTKKMKKKKMKKKKLYVSKKRSKTPIAKKGEDIGAKG